MAQGRQQNNGSRPRCAQSAAAKAPAEPPKAVCAQLEQIDVYKRQAEYGGSHQHHPQYRHQPAVFFLRRHQSDDAAGRNGHRAVG